ncbi:hypothetical protein AB1Y20_003504 [Prymnesium parvum]|uniref:CCHC-type domain-containing protein n=1 Tax=Prymnesium parvum TaxID=97485 RepID=A0AB34JC35_PRYPA
MKCPCCGQQGHRPRDCPTTCKECKQRSCPGNYGSPCVVVSSQFPTSILNAAGKPVPPNIKTILQKAHEKKGGQSSTKRTVNTLEAHALCEDNPHMWEVMNEIGKTSNALQAVRAAHGESVDHDTKEACPTFKTAEGKLKASPRMIMIDGGSNINLFNHKDVPILGTPIPGAPVQVSGWSDSVAQSVLANYRIDVQLKFDNGTMRRVTTEVAYSEQGRRDILSESMMWDTHSWSVLKEPNMRIDTPLGSVPLIRLNGVYFVEALILPPHPNPASAVEANVLSAKRHGALHLARLWAARLHVGSVALRRQLPAPRQLRQGVGT